jgi:hypothetical protein
MKFCSIPPSSVLQNVCSLIEFTEYLLNTFLKLKALAKTPFAVSIYVSLGIGASFGFTPLGSHICHLCIIGRQYEDGASC